MSNYNLSEFVLKSHYGDNALMTDEVELPSVMVYIPAFKNSDVLFYGDDSSHPAFIVNGKEIPGFYYSKYQNVVIDDKAYSLPGEDPQTFVNFDNSLACCESKGAGWHMSTAAEWAAIALWCKKNGFLPYGNNSYGKDSRESESTSIPTEYMDGKITRVATGTGPLTWSHDKTMSGIWDMNGNVWECQSGIRLVWGELQILANNDAADPDNPQNQTSTCWKAINAADGSLVSPECKTTDGSAKLSGATVRVDYVNNAWVYSTNITNAVNTYRNSAFHLVTCTASIGGAAKSLLKALALLPDDETDATDYESAQVYWNNAVAERCVARGGYGSQGTGAGLFSLSGSAERNAANTLVGFRSAYIPELE